MNAAEAPGYAFFRKCTLPSKEVMDLIEQGGHCIGLHLENSRSKETFRAEKAFLEQATGKTVTAFSKHGSGGAKFGFAHYAPYEAEKYLDWAAESGMKLFLGNLEDPTLNPEQRGPVFFYPSAFWLEPSWRDTKLFPVEWLKEAARERDVVLLIHPENVLADSGLTSSFIDLLQSLRSRILQ
jgi:hypothetical protein